VLKRVLRQNIKLPSINPERLAKIGNKVDPEFYKAYKLSQKVIANSLGKVENETLINWGSFLVVTKGMTLKGGKGLLYGTREALKFFIPKIRKIIRDSAKTTLKIPPEHMAQVAFGTTILLSISAFIIWLTTGFVRGSFEAVRDLKNVDPAVAQTVKAILLKTKAFISGEGGNGAKLVSDAKGVADDLVNKGKEAADISGEPMWLMIGFLLIGLGAVLSTIATIRE
jgi:hypothetical protein